jgi:urease accessory protein
MNKQHTTGFTFILATALALVPTFAHAHPGHSSAGGYSAGALHPLLGLDHLLAMLAVGLWAAQLGGRAVWLVPATFVSVMSLGGALGMGGLALPLVEQGVLVSVLVLGVLIVASARLPLAIGVPIVAVFALFHGFAHGAEMPARVSALAYGAGFAATTAGLHAAGLALGWLAAKSARTEPLRVAGAAIALMAVALWTR